ncbi:ATP-dependent Clp protease ATP-binding subunit [Actinocrinis puniceicyclus]|uniref:ATP-dependent Clp protease ATP-binding subunit n=1 Tax=Actinocrinis puniceicyclus TaxID=977794 RepID=A0A8J7WM43_9ACTN|nr:ATP-dependent Clp protease ATP-binding subunit [Actinocrinis puniceicyclus]MBS2961969.1 ATP-dependent Clp protease ATP-binding subunit [Actinocrinis puniceicyclus]
MPKINVYVPDELAEAVKEAGIPVSAVCQRALETAVRRVTAIREAVLTPSTGLEERSDRLTHFTQRSRTVLKLAAQEARDRSAAEVGTGHLLHGLLAEGGNLALQVLGAMEIDPEQIRREIDRSRADAPAASAAGPGEAGTSAEQTAAPAVDGLRFGSQAAAALELAVTEATSLGHNYVGCEHLLLGLVAEPDGEGGRILRGLGAELRLTRRAVGAAIAGYVHLRAQQGQNTAPATAPELADPMTKLSALIDQQLKPVVQRLERIENNMRLGDG